MNRGVAEDDFMVMLTIQPHNFPRIIELSKNAREPYTQESLERAWITNNKTNRVGFLTFYKPKRPSAIVYNKIEAEQIQSTRITAMTVDYRKLLLKFIEHVNEHEGTTFLNPGDRSSYEGMPEFTDEEWDELKRLEATININAETQPIDVNTVALRAGDQTIFHTYSTECPVGCHGQLDDCKHKES